MDAGFLGVRHVDCSHCESVEDSPSNINYSIIALACSLTVVLPLLCVCIVKCARQHRIKRHNDRQMLARQVLQQIPYGGINPQIHDAPPSYQYIFRNNNTFLPEPTSTEQLSTEDSHIQDNAAFISENDTENNASGMYRVSGQGSPGGNVYNTHDNNQQNHPTGTQQRRFPGMHLSIFDLITQDGGELTTPPPTYEDAMKIIGEIPPKYSEICSLP